MEVYFKRNLLQSYMVIEDSFYGGYDMTMLNRNRLPGFFTVKMVEAEFSMDAREDTTAPKRAASTNHVQPVPGSSFLISVPKAES